MSTRSNIIIFSPGAKVHQYYRHYDGYFESTGTDLILKLSTSFNNWYVSRFIKCDATEKQKVIDDIEKLNSTQCLPDWAQMPFVYPSNHYEWFLMEMAEDLRLSGNDESWEKNHYEPEEPFNLHGDIEWIYFVDFNSLCGDTAKLYYSHLGIGSEIRDKFSNDFVSMYNYVKLHGYCPVFFKKTSAY